MSAKRIIMGLSLVLTVSCQKQIGAPSTVGTMEECRPTAAPTELATSPSRAGYLLNYPGSTISEVHYFLAAGTVGNFDFTLNVRSGAFDGTLLGTSSITNVLVNGLGTVTEVVFSFSPPITIPDVSGNKTATFELIKDVGTGPIYGASESQSASCTFIQTNGVGAPLDSQNGWKVWATVILGN